MFLVPEKAEIVLFIFIKDIKPADNLNDFKFKEI
jgi:hypothetical protein